MAKKVKEIKYDLDEVDPKKKVVRFKTEADVGVTSVYVSNDDVARLVGDPATNGLEVVIRARQAEE